MKRFVVALALAALVTPAALAAAPQMEAQTVRGTVMDTSCYAAGKHGPEEAACTKMCLNMGVPASLLTESGDVLVLLPPADEGMEAFQTLKSHASHKVEITGMVMERDGLKAMTVTAIKMVD